MASTDEAMLPAELSGLMYCPPYTGFNSSYGVISAIHMGHEHARLDADRRFHIQPAHDGWDIEIVSLREFSWAQSVIAIRACAMVFGTERNRGRVWGFLADAVWTSVRGFDGFLRSANTAGLCSDPSQVTRIALRFHDSGTSPPHSRSQCRQ